MFSSVRDEPPIFARCSIETSSLCDTPKWSAILLNARLSRASVRCPYDTCRKAISPHSPAAIAAVTQESIPPETRQTANWFRPCNILLHSKERKALKEFARERREKRRNKKYPKKSLLRVLFA